MSRWHHRGGGRWVPGRPTPGLRAALAARDVADRVIAQRARQRREQESRAEVTDPGEPEAAV